MIASAPECFTRCSLARVGGHQPYLDIRWGRNFKSTGQHQSKIAVVCAIEGGSPINGNIMSYMQELTSPGSSID